MPLNLQIERQRRLTLYQTERAVAIVASQPPRKTPTGIEYTRFAKRPRRFDWDGLARIICFTCFAVILVFALDAMINSGLHRTKTSEFGVWNKIVQGQINADIIISGSSRALTQYDPRIIERTTAYSTF